LPHPFGPTMAVIPGLSSIKVFWANDLNPIISRLFKRIAKFVQVKFDVKVVKSLQRNISQQRRSVKQK